MIEKLRKVIDSKGAAIVAADLGYRSQTTVRKWVNNGKIPKLAEDKVKAYLKGKK